MTSYDQAAKDSLTNLVRHRLVQTAALYSYDFERTTYKNFVIQCQTSSASHVPRLFPYRETNKYGITLYQSGRTGIGRKLD